MRALQFKPMRAEDVPWVAEQESELHASPWSAQSFIDAMQAGYSCWVVWDDRQRVAYAIVMVTLDEAQLLNISVATLRQRQGIAAKTLRYIGQRAHEAGAHKMFLEVRPSNHAACALYQKFGFSEIARRKEYYSGWYPNSPREDAIVMRCALQTE